MTLQEAMHFVIVPGLKHLPGTMDSPEARAMLMAIGMQESYFHHRRQKPHGPARGWWQFEPIAVEEVLTHHRSRRHARAIVRVLHYPAKTEVIHPVLEHNDPLAAVFARLLLWTVPQRLPRENEPELAWKQYLEDSWRPGKPRHRKWARNYREAWSVV